MIKITNEGEIMRYLKVIIIIMLASLALTSCEEKTKKLENKQNDFIDVNDNQKYENENNNELIPVEKPTPDVNSTESSNKVPESPTPSITYSSVDTKTINTLEEIDKEVDTLVKSNDESIKDKVKGIFITLVDFIFYDGEINGVKFDELTASGKQKVLEITAKIDNKIEAKFPGYKETIASGTKSAFKKASDLIKKGASNINEFAKEKLGDSNYNAIIAAKDEFVKYTKNAFTITIKVGSSLLDKGKDALNDWYQKFKNNN